MWFWLLRSFNNFFSAMPYILLNGQNGNKCLFENVVEVVVAFVRYFPTFHGGTEEGYENTEQG